MARARRKTGDDATNARKRYTREASRYLRQADNATSPQMQARYRELARKSAEDALSTYEKQVPFSKMRKDLQEVALRTGAEFSTVDDAKRGKIRQRMITDKTSSRALRKERDTAQRRDYEARSLLNTHVGNRIFGSLAEIWQDAIDSSGNLDRDEMERLIFDFLGVSDWMSAIERFEEVFGEELYAEPENTFRYDNIVNSAVERLQR